MLVHIVIVPNADRSGPDLTRVGKLEEIPDELARLMLGNGTARLPDDEERADWEATREAREAGDQAAPAEAASHPVGDVPLPDDAGSADVAAAEANG